MTATYNQNPWARPGSQVNAPVFQNPNTQAAYPAPAQFNYQQQMPPQPYPNAPQMAPNYAPNNPNNKGNKNHKGLIIGLSAAAAAAVASGVIGAGVVLMGGDSEKGGPDTHERPSSMTFENVMPDDFNSDLYFTDAERTEWANEQLDAPSQDPEYPNRTVRQAAHDRLNDNLASLGRMSVEEINGGAQLVEPDRHNTASETNVQRIVTTAAALYENDPIKAEKLLSASYDNSSNENVRDSIADSHTTLSNAERMKMDTAVFFIPQDANTYKNTGTLVNLTTGLTAEEPPTRISYLHDSQASTSNRPDLEIEESYVDGHWVQTDTIELGDDDWIPKDSIISTGTPDK